MLPPPPPPLLLLLLLCLRCHDHFRFEPPLPALGDGAFRIVLILNLPLGEAEVEVGLSEGDTPSIVVGEGPAGHKPERRLL